MTPGIFRSLGVELKYNNVYNYSAGMSTKNQQKERRTTAQPEKKSYEKSQKR